MEERRKALPLPPEPPRRPRGNRVAVRPVRVGADQGRSGLPRGQQGADQADVRRDELAQPDRDCVRGEVGVEMVVRQLDPRKHQQVVERPCALGLGVDRGEVRGEGPFVDARLGHAPGVVRADDVIGDAEDVEAVAAVEIDEARGARSSPSLHDVWVWSSDSNALSMPGVSGSAAREWATVW